MDHEKEWLTDWDTAFQRSVSTDRPVLLDFFLRGWIGCMQMGAVTYPDEKVSLFIESEFIPLRQPPDGKTADAYHLRWTPTLLVLDDQGDEHHRLVGFLRPEHFVPALMLMKAKTRFAHARFEESKALLNQILEDYPGSFSAPEAVYLRAVSRYRLEKDTHILKEAQQDITARYPESEWAQRMWPYSKLK